MRRVPLVITLAALTLAAGATGPTAAAHSRGPAHRSATLAEGLVSPLSVDVAADGTVYFSQNFAGLLMKKVPGRKPKPIFASSGGREVGAVSIKNGVVTFATSGFDENMGSSHSRLRQIDASGRRSSVVDILAFERQTNPDADVQYGFTDISEECAASLPAEFGPATHMGLIDSHPYASTTIGDTVYVADAAANAVFAVRRGRIRTLAVLPPVAEVISAEAAAENGLPDCVVGLTYLDEPVPTGVDRTHGRLYVSTLRTDPSTR